MLDLRRTDIEHNPGQWFEFQGARVRLRYVPKHVLDGYQNQNTKTVFKNHQPVREVDEQAVQQDRVDYAVADWDGLSVDGAAFPCTRENKLWLYNNYAPFSYFVNMTLVALMTGEAVAQELEEKNCSASPDGTAKPVE